MLTPIDIHNKEFKRSFRGYSEREVDEFLDLLVSDYEGLLRENMDLKEAVQQLNTKLEYYQQMENTLHNTLVIAQETAEEVKLSGKKESELIIKEGEIRVQRMLEEATEKVRRMTAEYDELTKQMAVSRSRMRNLLMAQMELLNKTEEDES
ncbi:MAG: divIVA [Firmicutes bacterium]|nr:divIVA [Bacillota bacterium]